MCHDHELNICVMFFLKLAFVTKFCIFQNDKKSNLPSIVPVATGIVVGNAGVV